MPTIKLTERILKGLATEAVQEDFLDREFTAGGSFGVRVGRSGKKSFFLLYSVAGTRRRISLGSHPVISLEEARQRALGVLRSIAEGGDPRAVPVERGAGERFSRFTEQFLDEEIRPRCRPATVREYERIIRTELVPRWGDASLDRIRTRDIQTLLEEVSATRGSPVMANRIRALASKLFATALKRGLVAENPVRNIEPVFTSPAPERILEDEEIRMLWLALRMEKPTIAVLFKLLLLTGQFPGDLLRMRWDELHGSVWRSPSRKGSSTHARTRTETRRRVPDSRRNEQRVRLIPLSTYSRTLLQELFVATHRAPAAHRASENRRGPVPEDKAKHEGGFVFSTDGGTPLVYIRRASARISARMGSAHFSPSDLRRTAAARLARLGIRPDVIDEILGRTAHRTTPAYRVSGYDAQRDVEAALERWGSHIERLCSPSRRPPTPRPKGPRSGEKNKPREPAPHTAKIIPLFSEDR